jgi:Response regulators consisting of a CheY-like receiver domain and a winged-helix DNA-binding domain
MQVLLAEDDLVSSRMLEVMLARWGYRPVVVKEGKAAWESLQACDGPRLAILDWMMPEMDGTEICRRVRNLTGSDYTYIILLTARGQKEDVVEGLEAGADDYITKPFDQAELRSRLRAGERILELKSSLAQKVRELEDALQHVRSLQGLLPICMHCKKIRDETQMWRRMEAYIEDHSDAKFSHALCDECLAKYYPESADEDKKDDH